jgi:hypothetical protein
MQARFDRQETGVDRIERVGPDDDEDGYEDEDESDLVDEITRRI